jgi:hypothetical protein
MSCSEKSFAALNERRRGMSGSLPSMSGWPASGVKSEVPTSALNETEVDSLGRQASAGLTAHSSDARPSR